MIAFTSKPIPNLWNMDNETQPSDAFTQQAT